MDPLTGLALAALLASTSAEAGSATTRPATGIDLQQPDGTARWDAEIAAAARQFVVPQRWIRAVIAAESAGDPRAVSPKGAMGLMQLMPETWREMRERFGLGIDPFDPADNVLAGTAYLRLMYDRFGVPGFLAAYNAGPRGFEASLAGLHPLPDESRKFMDIIGRQIGFAASESPVSVAQKSGSDGLFFVLRK